MSTARLLLIDNYDSFTYNLVQYLGELGADIQVRRNNQVTLDEVVGEGIVVVDEDQHGDIVAAACGLAEGGRT